MGVDNAMRFRLVSSVIVLFMAAVVAACGVTSGQVTAGSGSPRPREPDSLNPAASASGRPEATPAITLAPCRTRDLGSRFQGGGYGGGNDFGAIQIWNAGPTRCRLGGAVTLTALFANGATDPNVEPNGHLLPLTVTLPAQMSPPTEGTEPARYLVAYLMGPERDDPAQPNGICRAQDEMAPATFELSIGTVTLVVRNQDPAAPQNHAVYGCHGRVLLEGVTPPQGLRAA
jgi:hypothetical protein